MIFQLQQLDKAASEILPEECQGCGWWQGYDDSWPATAADDWAESAIEYFGGWGKLAIADDELLGMIQYGPAGLFARANDFACGPVSADAVLLTCSLVAGDGFAPARRSLLTAVLADLKEREVETVEAFSYQVAAPEGECRMFDQDFLRDCGFYPVRSSRGLQLMRFELGGVETAPVEKHKSRRRILERIKRTAPAPVPAAICEAAEGCSGRVSVCP
ncbi:MAG: hypothetical protein Q7K29_04605 [Thermoleophilia bacterium]|nr:hypothetical protein [Thermoleophilia bacterium]